MAYDIQQMAIVWVPAHTNVPKGWSYINTDDTLATIEASGYFTDELRLNLNDSIRVTGSDGTAWLRVSQVAPTGPVQTVVDTNAVSSLLDGYLWVGNVSNAATAVLMSGDATMSNTGVVTLAEDTIKTATITVSTAELLALATTPKELVGAPGADKFVQFLGAQFVLNYNSVQYTESGDNMGIKYENAAGVQVSETIECTGFIDQAADTITNAIPIKDAIVAASGAVNKALVLDNLGSNFAAGNSPVDVIISYKILTAGL